MTRNSIAIIGAGPYGLSLAAHLSSRNIEHRIFGRPMQFWSDIARAGSRRFLKSYCFGTNLSTPKPGFSFANYSEPRGLETFEPCAISDFADYGRWFQKGIVPWLEPVDVVLVQRDGNGFALTLADGSTAHARHVVVATGLSYFAKVPEVLKSLPVGRAIHTSGVRSFAEYRGRRVAVIGAGQSALEAAALLHEAGARPELLIREDAISWMSQISQQRSLWRRLRSPISGLGTGPKAWALTQFPGAVHRLPARWRTRFAKSHLPPEGAWWLRNRVEKLVPTHFGGSVTEAREVDGHVELRIRSNKPTDPDRQLVVDHVIAGCGYDIDVERLEFLDDELRRSIERVEGAPKLNGSFESSVRELRFIGPASAMSFGPLFRFVVGAEYASRVVASTLMPNHK